MTPYDQPDSTCQVSFWFSFSGRHYTCSQHRISTLDLKKQLLRHHHRTQQPPNPTISYTHPTDQLQVPPSHTIHNLNFALPTIQGPQNRPQTVPPTGDRFSKEHNDNGTPGHRCVPMTKYHFQRDYIQPRHFYRPQSHQK